MAAQRQRDRETLTFVSLPLYWGRCCHCATLSNIQSSSSVSVPLAVTQEQVGTESNGVLGHKGPQLQEVAGRSEWARSEAKCVGQSQHCPS